ncbi:hypothetical protein WISP_137376 [Willisornis vidua]|uniref:Uncharacterized protein n=1 Tax=Willisornis vidua TaxID=1566151 RepID=A0ABQ9CN38_9PASS|nr:hypothetical protein WISP_137376 [Willisornis vidua]
MTDHGCVSKKNQMCQVKNLEQDPVGSSQSLWHDANDTMAGAHVSYSIRDKDKCPGNTFQKFLNHTMAVKQQKFI